MNNHKKIFEDHTVHNWNLAKGPSHPMVHLSRVYILQYGSLRLDLWRIECLISIMTEVFDTIFIKKQCIRHFESDTFEILWKLALYI